MTTDALVGIAAWNEDIRLKIKEIKMEMDFSY